MRFGSLLFCHCPRSDDQTSHHQPVRPETCFFFTYIKYCPGIITLSLQLDIVYFIKIKNINVCLDWIYCVFVFCVSCFPFFFFFFSSACMNSNRTVHVHGFTVQEKKIHCLQDPHSFYSKIIKKIGLMILFTYLKIILLQYFQFLTK